MEISDWSELLPDLLIMIARRIQLMEDFMAFRGVCTSWRAAASVDNFVKSWPTVPLLMLAEKKDTDYRKFYSLSRGKIWRRMPLPEAKASPSETSDFVVVIVGGGGRFLLLWRPGDMSWTRIESAQYGAFNDVYFYKGKFYAITYGGHIWVWDMLDPPEAQYYFTINRELIDFRRSRLVESAGELFVVARDGAEYDDDEQTYGVTNFRVVQLDLIKREWKEIDNLGDMAIFVGHNDGFSLDAT
ncbi:probable F-box protein At1g44080 [Coffea arabica]|uniref:Probable F-box protein At1g44080 n=1 Tax=Coffea arabica TaxID=13443 RepID=A0A6P6V0D5_COFAR|nr:probable F-box protein At1g44080 [Coffea arabica]